MNDDSMSSDDHCENQLVFDWSARAWQTDGKTTSLLSLAASDSMTCELPILRLKKEYFY